MLRTLEISSLCDRRREQCRFQFRPIARDKSHVLYIGGIFLNLCINDVTDSWLNFIVMHDLEFHICDNLKCWCVCVMRTNS